MESIFFDIGILMIIATVFGYLARLVKQPLIPAYILTGIIIGPSIFGVGLITDQGMISILSEIGIAFMLFVIGMELDLSKLKNTGLVAPLGGTISVLLLAGLGFALAYISGVFTLMESAYISAIFAFSSTMVVVKILADKKEINTLHGRIIIGILLIQDIFAIIAISTLTSIDDMSLAFFLISVLKAALIFVVTIFLSRKVFPSIFKESAKSHELLLLSSISVCFIFAIGLYHLGFSIAIGGFLGGISLAHLPYNIEMISRMRSLKDFFATIFFVSLGMEMSFVSMDSLLVPIITFVMIIIIFKPLIFALITSVFGYSKRTSFMTGTYLAQISEFSLILVSQGIIVGNISSRLFTLTVTIAVMTIILSTYFMKYSHHIYLKFSNSLFIFDRISKNSNKEIASEPLENDYKAIIVGYSDLAYSIIHKLRELRKEILVIDYDPDLIRKLLKDNINCLYGDIGDAETLEKINFKDAEMVISTIPGFKDNMLLIKNIKEKNEKSQIFVTSDSVRHALKLYDEGADYVILPHFLGGDHVSLMLEEVSPDINKMLATKLKHIEELNKRHSLGHKHPFHHNPKKEH